MKRSEAKIFKGKNYSVAVAPGRTRKEDLPLTSQMSGIFQRAALRQGFKISILTGNDQVKVFTFGVDNDQSFDEIQTLLDSVSSQFNLCLTLTLEESLEGEEFQKMKDPREAMNREKILYSYPTNGL